jgi:hypothetical protein
MNSERLTAVLAVGLLVLRIEQLELEEQGAILRRDWSTARGIARERAILKEAHHRALARNHSGRRNG